MSILEVFCSVDDFWQQFAPSWRSTLPASDHRKRLFARQMYLGELMTIVILLHRLHYGTFKAYCTEYDQQQLRSEFPTLLSYQRLVQLMPTFLEPLVCYLYTQLGRSSGISFIDSASLVLGRNPHIQQHRMFAGRVPAAKSQSAGSTVSSCACSSMIKANYWPFA